jgi:hypothetical protein
VDFDQRIELGNGSIGGDNSSEMMQTTFWLW